MIGRWGRRARRMAGLFAALGLLLYLGDWGVLELRVRRGTGYRMVEVTQFLATKLKGQKTEYDMMGSFQETCSRSVFPQNGNPPCWWLERHKSQWE